MTKSLEEIEEEHGFVFGVPDDDPSHGQKRSRVMKHLKCTTLGCERADERADAIVVHHDTALPIVCGGCGVVLHCEHEAGDEIVTIEGSLAEPVRHIKIPCRNCHALITERTEKMKPVTLENLPASALAALGVPFSPYEM